MASNHRASGQSHRIVVVTAPWTVRCDDRFPRRGGQVILSAGAAGGLDHSGGPSRSRPGRRQRSGAIKESAVTVANAD
jgi:hypothetical protein